MTKKFVYELFVGVILLIAILLFGTKGLAAMALLAVHPFIGKRKPDENEKLIFYKTGNYTAGATLLASIVVFYFSDTTVNGQLISKNWLGFVVSVFIISHGIAGIILFKKR